MAISFVGSMAPVGANNGGNVTLTFTGASGLLDAAGGQASLAQGDVVVVAYASSGVADAAMSTTSADWTEVHEAYSNGSSNDTNLALYYKVMGAVPDTSFVAVGPTGNNNGTIATAFAFRGMASAVLDIAFVAGSHAATGTASTRPNAPAITPSTAGAWILVAGAGAAAAGSAFTNPGDLSSTTNHFRSANHAETIDIAIGIGIKTDWASGAFDPAAWTGGAANAGDSWAALVIALKPDTTQALTPGPFTNSQTFPAATVTRGTVDLTPSLFTGSQTFHAAALSLGLAASLFTNTQAFGAAEVTQADPSQTLQPGLVSNTQTFYGPTIAPGAVTLLPPLASNTQTFHAPTVTVGAVTLTPGLFSNGQAFYAPTVAGGPSLVLPPLLTNSVSFYGPTVAQFLALRPALLTNDQAFPAALLRPLRYRAIVGARSSARRIRTGRSSRRR